jgi:hypothetical protein
MKFITLFLALISASFAQTQAPAPPPAPQGGPIITWADANDQDYYVPNGYGGYYYGGGYYGYGGGYGGRGRDWNNYSDGRYEDRGNHRGADRARGGGGRGGGRR